MVAVDVEVAVDVKDEVDVYGTHEQVQGLSRGRVMVYPPVQKQPIG